MKRMTAVCLSLWLLLLTACSGSKDQEKAAVSVEGVSWPVFRGDSNLSGVAASGLSDRLRLLWSYQTGSYIVSSPVLGFGNVYIGSTDGKVYSLSLSDGGKVWEFDTGDDIEASPLLMGGSVYIGNLSGDFFALDALSGEVLWRFECGSSIYGSANGTGFSGEKKGKVLVGSYDNRVYCFEAETGTLEWSYETDNYINGAPATDGRHIVFGGCDELLHILSISDGTKKGEVWAGSYIPGSAALIDNRAYLGHYDNKVVCIDIEDQKIVWEYEDKEHGMPFFSSPAVGDSRIVIGSRDRFLHCIDRETGTKIWDFETRDEIDGSPVIAGDKVIVGSIDGRLYLLGLTGGKEVWTYEIGAAIIGSPAVDGGLVVIGAEDGRIYAFGENP